MKNLNRMLLLGVMALICREGSAEETIKLAFISGLSGSMAMQAVEAFKDYQAATDMVNSRGGVLDGRRFEMVAYDNKFNAQDTLVAMRKAVDENIQFLFAGNTMSALAINEGLAKHNERNPAHRALLLDYNAQDPDLTESKCTFWHFRFTPHSDTSVSIIADQIARQPDIRKVYLINQDYAFGQSVSRAAREALKQRRPDIEIVGDDFHPIGKVKDFAPYISKIIASGAQAVITGNWGNDLILLIKGSNDAGSKAVFYALNGTVPGTVAGIGPAGLNRLRTLGSWQINAADATWRTRLLEYKAKYAAVSNLDFIQIYRSVEMLAQGINKAGTTDPAKVAYALEGMKYSGPTGEIWMRADDHQVVAPLFLFSLAKAGQAPVQYDEEGSGYVWKTDVFIDAKDTVPPVKCRMQRPGE